MIRPPAARRRPTVAPRRLAAAALLAATGACAHAGGRAAGAPEFSSDRPSFAEGTGVVGRGRVQVEAGDTFSREQGGESNALGELLVRVGVVPAAEVRLELNSLLSEHPAGEPGRRWHTGREDAAVGAKVRLLGADGGRGESGGLVPDVSVLVSTSVPSGTRGLRHAAEPEARLLLGWRGAGGWEVESNVNVASRAGEEGRGRTPEASGSVSVGHPLLARVDGFAEAYAVRPRHLPGTQYLDGGVSVRVRPELQLDAWAGRAVGGAPRDVFVGLGVARRW